MALRPQESQRGLSSLNESRAQRRRSIVHGKVRMREVATRFWLLTFVGIGIFSVAYWKYSQVELESRKQALRARQRAVKEALGPKVPELRRQLEQWLVQLAGEEMPPVLTIADWKALRQEPVLYVRMAQDRVADLGQRRAAIEESLRDGFTSCLLPTRKGVETGVPCKQTSQCEPGLRCAREGVCREPDSPYNLSYLNDGLRVLEDEWSQALSDTNNEFEVRAMELALEEDAKHAVPMAVEVARRSRFFLAVIDEPANGEVTSIPGLRETSQQRLQTTEHFVRVGIWDIEEEKPLAFLRLQAGGEFVNMGRGSDPAADQPGLRRARQRQVNNCALAVQVREALRDSDAEAPLP